jgi:hypothetical protein
MGRSDIENQDDLLLLRHSVFSCRCCEGIKASGFNVLPLKVQSNVLVLFCIGAWFPQTCTK